MNRRNFLKNSALALFGFSVLPPSKTYERIWKARKVIPGYVFNPADYQGEWGIRELNPAWVNAPYEVHYLFSDQTWETLVPTVMPTPKEVYVLGGKTPPRRFVGHNGSFVEVKPFDIDLDTSSEEA